MAEKTAAKDTQTPLPKKRVAKTAAVKKVTEKTVKKPVAVKRVASKRIAARPIEEKPTTTKRIPTGGRKAPTTVPQRGPAKHFPVAVTLSAVAFALAFGASAIVGFQGNGAIDVAQVIEARAQRVSQQGGGENQAEVDAVTAAANNAAAPASNVPNGGLRGAGKSATKPPESVVDEVLNPESITFVDAASSTEATQVDDSQQEDVSAEEVATTDVVETADSDSEVQSGE